MSDSSTENEHTGPTIRDRRRLESGSCECYGAMRAYYDRALQPGKLLPVAPAG